MINLSKKIGFILLIAIFVIFFLSLNVLSKPLTVGVANSTLNARNFSTNISIAPTCDMNYTEITFNILQKLFLAQPYPNNSRIDAPRMMGDRYTLFIVSDNAVTFHYYYLYDSGADGLWLTGDDRAIYITNNSLMQGTPTGMPDLYGEVSEYGGVTRFYWSLYRYLNSQNRGSHLYRCTLSNQSCVQHEFINYIDDRNPEVIGLVPLESQDRLFMAIREDSMSPTNFEGGIFSCSLAAPNSTNLDSCYSSYFSFTKHSNYTAYVDNIKDTGFIYYEPNPSVAHSFFNAEQQISMLLPVNTLMDSRTASRLGNLFFTYRR